jgi:hypothetical protein
MTQANPPMLPICPPRTSGMAIASLVLGIAAVVSPPYSFCFCCVPGLVLAILAIVFGHTARGQIRSAQGMLSGSGMAMAGLVCGYAAVAIHIFAFIAYAAILLISAISEHHQHARVFRM